MKYAWMAKHAGLWPVAKLCRALEVSPSGFKAWRGGGKRGTQRLSDGQLLVAIGAIHAKLKGAYGSPRMHKELREGGYRVGKTRVERLMRENAIRAGHKKRWKATTDSNHALAVAPNLIARNFSPAQPNALLGSRHHLHLDR